MLTYDFWILDIFWKLIIQFDHTLDPIHGVYIGKLFQGLTTNLRVVIFSKQKKKEKLTCGYGSCHGDIM